MYTENSLLNFKFRANLCSDEDLSLRLQDKLGPFCRSAVDCAIVLDAIRGKDGSDPSSREVALGDPFHVDITKLTVGYLDDAEMEVLQSFIICSQICSLCMGHS